MSRYKNVNKPVFEGERFDSDKELKRWQELKLLERAGVIRGLKRQVPFPITIAGVEIRVFSKRYHKTGRHLVYVADAVYFDVEKGEQIIEDTKGHVNEVYKIKRALMRAMGYTILET